MELSDYDRVAFDLIQRHVPKLYAARDGRNRQMMRAELLGLLDTIEEVFPKLSPEGQRRVAHVLATSMADIKGQDERH